MKKVTASIAILSIVALGFVSCGKSGTPKAGTAKGDDMLGLFPAEADGIFFLDMKRAMEADFIQKAMERGAYALVGTIAALRSTIPGEKSRA